MSELRRDLVSGDWIIMAPERLRRPHDFISKKKTRKPSLKNSCPFEDSALRKVKALTDESAFPSVQNWNVAVIPNKYPALTPHGNCATAFNRGPYSLMEGVGRHDVVVTRDHNKNFANLAEAEALEVFQVMQKRYKEMAEEPCVLYTSTFFNWGASAGASIYHPHYQIISLPIIPPDVQHSLSGTERYFKKYGKCAHCEMTKYELKEGERVIEENAQAVVFAPFFSRQPFEIRVVPKKHLPYFEECRTEDLRGVASVLQKVIRKISKHLNDPDFNFFIHTAPFKGGGKYSHYHWHIELLPKVTIPAGFELSTGVEINVIDPNSAAAILRRP